MTLTLPRLLTLRDDRAEKERAAESARILAELDAAIELLDAEIDRIAERPREGPHGDDVTS